MPRRRDDGVLADLFETAAVLPWWLDVVIAAVVYAVFGHFAAAKVPAGTAPADIGHVLGMVIRKALLLFGQYIVPPVLLLGAVASALGRRRRKGLLRDVADDESGRALRAMDWRDFELLVGEAFRRRGFWVSETGGGGADDGIDLKLEKGGEVFLVQCKQWRAYKVSVNVVRELLGVMVAQGAVGGFVVTSGVFTKEAREFAKGSSIELLDGAALMAMIGEERIARAGAAAMEGTGQALVASPSVGAPACPVCGRGMVRRTARRGANAGGDFWGCAAFPECRGTREIGDRG